MRYLFIYSFLFSYLGIAQTTNILDCNCCDETHKQFDFWKGNWEVTDASGKLLGTNTIDKVQENCVLRENWKSANGKYTGTSYNYYNLQAKQWEQVWVDNQGGSLYLKGNRVGNEMILKTDELINKDGLPYYHKITWTLNNDGSVRQLWETITNKTEVTISFDGTYRKVD